MATWLNRIPLLLCAQMKGIFEGIEQYVAGGETVATATVVRTEGSTPREVGAKMVVRPSGDIVGTIGGGCGEAEVWQEAMYAIKERKRRTMSVDLTADITLDTEMVCGGVMTIFIDLWDEREMDFLRAINRAGEERKRMALATLLSTGRARPRKLILAGGESVGGLGKVDVDDWITSQALDALSQGVSRTVPHPEGGADIFIEVQMAPPTLLIAGAGHIAVPLARLGSLLGFRVAVLDDRPAFANRERFPDAHEVLAAGFGQALASYPLDEQTYVAIMTRGHAHDMECLLQVVDKPVAYIGMIGSRRRVRGVLDLAKEQGYSDELLARVHAPIGLDIGARTPEEIALSVMAEVVMVRRGGSGGSLSGRDVASSDQHRGAR